MKMSDMFKPHGRDESPEEKKPKDSSKEAQPEQAPEPHKEAPKKDVSIKMSSIINKEMEKGGGVDAEKLYDEVAAKARHLYTTDLKKESNLIKGLEPLIDKIIAAAGSNADDLVTLCLKDYPDIKDFLYYHAANVCLISVAMGKYLGQEKARLLELGVASLIHDIGLKDSDLIHCPDKFLGSDYDKLRRHPEEGATILKNLESITQGIIEAVHQEHERPDGSGYPKGLVMDDINEYAQILSLTDMYEALMHDRPYRTKYTSLDTMELLLKNKKVFNRKILKALIEVVGIFPLQSLVQLNTKEIGVVMEKNMDCITRPVVDVLIDSYGRELKSPKRVILAENPLVYINNCVRTETNSHAAS